MVAADWAEGFMEALEPRPRAWQPIIGSAANRSLIAPIVVLLHDDDGTPLIQGSDEKIEKMRRETAALIAPCVVAIERFWKARRE